MTFDLLDVGALMFCALILGYDLGERVEKRRWAKRVRQIRLR